MTTKKPRFLSTPEGPRYATEYAGRKPKFKVHATLGHARNSRGNHVGYRVASERYNKEWQYYYASSIEEFVEKTTFDIFEYKDGQWAHLPEESVDPLSMFDVETVEYEVNAWLRTRARQNDQPVPPPKMATRVRFKLKGD